MNVLERAIAALGEGIAVFDGDLNLIYCNDVLRRMTAPASQVLKDGCSWGQFLAELSTRSVYAATSLEALGEAFFALQSGQPAKTKLELQRGDLHWHAARLRPDGDAGLILSLTDITSDRNARDRLSQAGSLLRKVLQHAPASLVIYDMDAERLLYRTPHSSEMFGGITDRITDTWWDPDERKAYLVDLIATGRVDNRDIIGVRGDGSPFPARISARLIRHEGNRVIVASTQDISALVAQRDEISRINQRLFDAIEALDQGFALYDAQDRFVLANARFRDLNAPVAPHLQSATPLPRILIAAEDADHPNAALHWPPGESGEFRLDDGRDFAIASRRMSDGGTVVVWRDVTEAKQAEKELQDSREAAFQTEKLAALGELLTGVAHELNNPLSVVVGQSFMLGEETTDPGIAHRVEQIGSAANRCARIVRTFLAMAREQPLERTPTDLSEVVLTAVDVAAMSPALKSVNIETEISPDLPMTLADEDQLSQVLVNLLLNAGQAMTDTSKPKIRVQALQSSGRIELSVSDNGPGVPEALRPRIFEPFFTTKDIGQGTGVGLALSQRIVEAHGGQIQLRPALKGAEFVLSIPVVAPENATVVAETHSLPGEARTRILLVEDETDVAATMIEILRQDGAEVTHCLTAEAALEALDHGRFEAIVSDIRMPGRGGLHLFDNIMRNHPDMGVRIGFLTGDTMGPEAEKIRRDGNVPLLEKPVAPEELRLMTRKLVSGGQPSE